MPKTVLVVDDSATMRQMISFAMTDAGFTVIEGGNGKEALERLDGKKVDLVITDLNMPIMDGITLIKQIRAQVANKFTPILMLTTESQETKKQEGKAAGATGWVVKPFDPQQLIQVVGKLVR